MSRIVVKNLPKEITAKKLENLFSTKGCITDLQLKYNKAGVFRRFAFIGYKTEEEANEAKKYFHNTFVNTSKIQVEICKNLGDPDTPKPWKKTAIVEKIETKNEKKETKKSKKTKPDVIPEDLKNDPQFKEFLSVNKDRKSKPVWAEDIVDLNDSDLEDLHSSADENTEETISDKVISGVTSKDSKENKQAEDKICVTEDKPSETSPIKQVTPYNDMFTVKIRNLPYNCKKSHIKKFFNSLKITSLRIPPKVKGFAYVSFKTEKDLKQAINKHRGFLDGHRVDVVKYVKKVDTSNDVSKSKQDNNSELNEELLAETGRIYVRNLCYTVTEEEIRELFGKFGTIAEIHLPIDFLTKKSQGFAFVSYVFAEHAVKAFTELDGTIFQGRVLHLIPAKAKKEYKVDENETSFKKKKAAKLKEQSSNSSDVWNILFVGTNAVADVVAEKYNVEKSKFLSGDSKGSVAVRMALAETELVLKTRKFLIDNGVKLDAFSQPAAERSKTVIVVKHLPAHTTSQELNELFSKHGTVSRVLLPPSGLVALVEYENPSEAKVAFKKLAYSRFHHLPLYLEWAPVDGLTEPPAAEDKEETKEEGNSQKEDLMDGDKSIHEEEVPPPNGTTIFVKNMNFNTTQESFEKHFKQCGPIYQATISMKKDPKKGKLLSMGFGFVQFKKKESAIFALQNLQHSLLDGHSLELKFANRDTVPTTNAKRKKQEVKKQTSSKILVRNVPFQATEKELRDIFKEFGTLQYVRLPKKFGAPGEHRGFAFVEYQNADAAKMAFESLCHSTHLFNRRLVLEWANSAPEDIQELRQKTATNYSGDKPRTKLLKSKLKEDVALAAVRHGANEEDED